MENGQRVFLHERRKLAVLDQFADLAMAAAVHMPVGVVMVLVNLGAVVVVVRVRRVCMGGMLVPMIMFVVLVATMFIMHVAGFMRMLMLALVMVMVLVAVFMTMLMLVLVMLSVFVMLVRVRVAVVFLVMMMAFVLFLLILVVRVGRAFVDAKFHAFQILPLLALEVHVEIAEVELGKLPLQGRGFDAKIDEGADGHIAGDAGEAVEEEDFHGCDVGCGWLDEMERRRVRSGRAGSAPHRRGLCR
jgi:hypothetical protein